MAIHFNHKGGRSIMFDWPHAFSFHSTGKRDLTIMYDDKGEFCEDVNKHIQDPDWTMKEV